MSGDGEIKKRSKFGGLFRKSKTARQKKIDESKEKKEMTTKKESPAKSPKKEIRKTIFGKASQARQKKIEEYSKNQPVFVPVPKASMESEEGPMPLPETLNNKPVEPVAAPPTPKKSASPTPSSKETAPPTPSSKKAAPPTPTSKKTVPRTPTSKKSSAGSVGSSVRSAPAKLQEGKSGGKERRSIFGRARQARQKKAEQKAEQKAARAKTPSPIPPEPEEEVEEKPEVTEPAAPAITVETDVMSVDGPAPPATNTVLSEDSYISVIQPPVIVARKKAEEEKKRQEEEAQKEQEAKDAADAVAAAIEEDLANTMSSATPVPHDPNMLDTTDESKIRELMMQERGDEGSVAEQASKIRQMMKKERGETSSVSTAEETVGSDPLEPKHVTESNKVNSGFLCGCF